METELAEAANEFTQAKAKFQAIILKAAANGRNANQITLAIRHAYSPDYVRRLIREARAAGKMPDPDESA